MSAVIPQPSTVAVAYQPPHVRALSAGQRAALAALISAVTTTVLSGALSYLQGNNFTQAATRAILISVVSGIITSLLAFVQKFFEAKGDDAKNPPVTPATPISAPVEITLSAQPPLPASSDAMAQVLEVVLRDWANKNGPATTSTTPPT